MNNVVNMSDFRKEPPDQYEWITDVSIFADKEGNFLAKILDANDDVAETDAERLRVMARSFFHIGWLAMKAAHKEAPQDDSDLLAVAQVFASSRVRTQIDDDRIVTEAQMKWLDARFDDAKGAARL